MTNEFVTVPMLQAYEAAHLLIQRRWTPVQIIWQTRYLKLNVSFMVLPQIVGLRCS